MAPSKHPLVFFYTQNICEPSFFLRANLHNFYWPVACLPVSRRAVAVRHILHPTPVPSPQYHHGWGNLNWGRADEWWGRGCRRVVVVGWAGIKQISVLLFIMGYCSSSHLPSPISCKLINHPNFPIFATYHLCLKKGKLFVVKNCGFDFFFALILLKKREGVFFNALKSALVFFISVSPHFFLGLRGRRPHFCPLVFFFRPQFKMA